jgi:hypothetical protein
MVELCSEQLTGAFAGGIANCMLITNFMHSWLQTQMFEFFSGAFAKY